MNQPIADFEVQLAEVLTKLETSLLTPQVSGELDRWVGDVHDAAQELCPVLRQYLETVLHSQYVQISKTDEELLPRVEQMIEEDRNILSECDSFLAEIQALAAKVPGAERDELKVAERRARAESQGIALITRIRRQRAAAATWLSEAFYRDRGPVD